MADYERRNNGYRGGGGGRKRRYRGEQSPEGLFLRAADQEPFPDDEDYDRRPQRRRYEEPLFVQVRRQLLTIAESVGSPSFTRSRRVVVLHYFRTGH